MPPANQNYHTVQPTYSPPIQQREIGPDPAAFWFVIGLLLFIGVIFIIWRCLLPPNSCEVFIGGRVYSTRNAFRIFGRSGEDIVNGKWTAWIQSLWCTHSYDREYFVLTINEVEDPHIQVLKAEEAKKYLLEYAGQEHAEDLFREWFGKKKTTTYYHDGYRRESRF